MRTLNFVYDYFNRGWSVLPIDHGEKAPRLRNWQQLMLDRDDLDDWFGKAAMNIGVLLGEASGGLVDVDLDCEEAIELAPSFLPSTNCVFGRASKPQSHWLYKVEECGRREAFQLPGDGMILEYRANGVQTVMPGSTHPSGETIAFDSEGQPEPVDRETLMSACRRLAAASILVRHWQEGSRHDMALAVAGWLLKGGLSQEDTLSLIEAIARAAGDGELDDRLQCVRDTAARIEGGIETVGASRLQEVLGVATLDRLSDWIGIGRSAVPVAEAADGDVALAGDARVLAQGGRGALTESGNAYRFAHDTRNQAMWCQELNSWLVWDHSRWARDTTGQIILHAQRSAFALLKEAAARQSDDAVKWARQSLNAAKLENTLRLAKPLMAVPASDLDADPWLLNVENGTVDLRTGELQEHDPANRITKLCPVTFDAEAEAPTFQAFLERILEGDQAMVGFLKRALGYSLTGRTDEQCVFLMVGTGANGKSTLLNVHQALLGDYANQLPMDALMVGRSGEASNDLAMLDGARHVAASEAEPGQQLAEAKLKGMSGGDPIAARFLYGEFFEYVPQFKLWLSTNRRPQIRGSDEGIWRRLHVIPLNAFIRPEERDRGLSEKLLAELPGILNWAIEGSLEWQQEGLRPPKKVQQATAAYRADMDQVGQFIEDECVQEHGARVTAGELRHAYEAWCEELGFRPFSGQAFARRLDELGFEKARDGRNRYRVDLRLRGTADEFEDDPE